MANEGHLYSNVSRPFPPRSVLRPNEAPRGTEVCVCPAACVRVFYRVRRSVITRVRVRVYAYALAYTFVAIANVERAIVVGIHVYVYRVRARTCVHAKAYQPDLAEKGRLAPRIPATSSRPW